MKHLTIQNLLSPATLIFGLLTLFASSAVLFNYTTVFQKTGNYPAFILWMNLLTGPLYIMAAVGLKKSKRWTLHLLLAILTMLFINLGFFLMLMKNGGDYEMDTLMVLAFRIAFTGILAFFAFNKPIKRDKIMKRLMRKLLVLICTFTIGSTMAQNPQENVYSLRVEADNFRNSRGVAQFALYNRDGTIPDEKLKRYFKKEVGKIVNGKSFVTFEDLPKGRYAVTVLHDENSNEEIDKTLFFPKEGFGLTNFEKISLSNRPDFSKASFVLSKDAVKKIKLIYK